MPTPDTAPGQPSWATMQGATMASKTIVVYVDDVTGKEVQDVRTVTLTHEGIAYELDMGPDTFAAYEKAIEKYRAAGRRIGRVTAQGGNVVRALPSSASKPDKEQNRAMREWWHRYGAGLGLPEASDRGRIPDAVQEAYNAHGGHEPRSLPEASQEASETSADVSTDEDVKPAGTPRKATAVGARMSIAGENAESTKTPRPRKRSANVKAEAATKTAKESVS